MFTWQPLYKEIASKLLTFETNQSELILLMEAIGAAKLSTISTLDRPTESTRAQLTAMDPFTFFAIFNRSLTQQNRLKNLQFIKKRWQLSAPLPRDFNGIPTMTPQNSWFFPWGYLRSPDDIPSLWKLARSVVERGWTGVSAENFNRCLDIHTVGVGKLTTGLFWLAPADCLPLPSITVEYLNAKNIPVEISDKASLDQLLARVRSELSANFIKESHNAWLHCSVTDQQAFDFSEILQQEIWSSFNRLYPDFVDFANPGKTFASQETDYKRQGLQNLADRGGRNEIRRLLDTGDPTAALQLIIKTVSLNIASFQSWRPSIGLDQPEIVSDVLRSFLDATEEPYAGPDTLQPIFDSIDRHGLKPAWDTISVLLWGLRPEDYFPIKISYYRSLAEKLGYELASGRPNSSNLHQVIRFARAFWKIAEPKAPKDWVDVQSFIWGVCRCFRAGSPEPVPSPAIAKNIWLIAPGENARLWPEFQNDKIIAIGWDNLGDLNQYASKQAIAKALQAQDSTTSRSNDALCCWEFIDCIQTGDLVIAKNGVSKIVGLGRITSGYVHHPERGEYHHVRQVQWLKTGNWEFDESIPLKTLTNLKTYPDFARKILTTLDEVSLIEELYTSGAKPAPLVIEPPAPIPITPPCPIDSHEPYTMEQALDDLFMSREKLVEIRDQLKRKLNIVLQGPPGVGKTFAARRLAYLILESKDDSRIEVVQFHPNTSYEDFVIGLRPNGMNSFTLKPGVFHRFCTKAQRNPDKPHVFIIDEINRGNLAKVLGELMMLIEHDKRGPQYALSLAHGEESGAKFHLPPNLYIIGTMNTADRSLALVDYALRRRFAFIALEPDLGEKFKQALQQRGCTPEWIEKICARVASLNVEICRDVRSLGRGYQIGHSFFCDKPIVSDATKWYSEIVNFELKPLLEEYWMDDSKKAAEEVAKLLV